VSPSKVGTRGLARGTQSLMAALVESFEVSLLAQDGVAAPVALLWPDPDAQWAGMVPLLRAALPQFYVLGTCTPADRTGPAIWLRCVVDRTLPEGYPEPGVTPILYLPGVARQTLRSPGDCPSHLLPLVELQYRGKVWHQRNGRDWTVDAFVMSEDGVGLDVAQDVQTREALLRSLPLLAETPLAGLRGKRLDSDDFDRLAVSDPIRDMLRWIGAPEVFRKSLDEGRWKAFCNVCKSDLDFDPDRKTPRDAAKLLVEGPSNRWPDVWQRFAEAPHLYIGVAQALREVPSSLLTPERIPKVNTAKETELRVALEGVDSQAHADACKRVLDLEAAHGTRRGWVWAQLGESPLVLALAPLADLASRARSAVGGASLEEAVDGYIRDAWKCDKAALVALSSVQSPADVALVRKVVHALHLPWSDSSARRFQGLVSADEAAARAAVQSAPVEEDTCIAFADGLRYDLGRMLAEQMEERGFRVSLGHRMAPLPTVTATAKPVACHTHVRFKGSGSPADFTPLMEESAQPATAVRLREQMAGKGVDVLGTSEPRPRASGASFGWAEMGRLDELGHKIGADLVTHLDAALTAMADHVAALLDNGWQRVKVVTDHGWLLLPGGLPKVELPAHLVATKWSRCAAVVGESTTSVPTYGWYWDPNARIASPPGVGSFVAGMEYAHGGVSLQECVVPELMVERAGAHTKATIEVATWRAMRCRVSVKASDPTVRLDLRLNWKQAHTSIVASVKEVGPSGEASLVVDDKHEGTAATFVLLDSEGNVLDRKPTTVGEAS